MTGTVTISIEVELAWGFHASPGPASDLFSKNHCCETVALQRILSLCDKLSIPVSFDLVGHLLLPDCNGHNGANHDTDWFDADPETDSETDPLYYAPDLVAAIQDAKTDHEICTHTFSHVPCGTTTNINYDAVDQETLRWELEKAIEVHTSANLDRPVSLVPPYNSPPPMDILAELGFKSARVPMGETPTNDVRRFVSLLNRQLPVARPQREAGILKTYSTPNTSLTAPFLPNGPNPPHWSFRFLPRSARKQLHSRYLNRTLEETIKQNSYAHLWTHLFNLANDVQLPLVEGFLHSLAQARDAGAVQLATMDELPNQV